MMDAERILASGIPDIALVYGGVRGRTMSSRHQAYAWPLLREAGVRSIIDLREGGGESRLQGLCERNGMEYFNFPVDNNCCNMPMLLRLFPDLCRLIDEGDFYISCSMGLHRTDIALCAYWVFHAAEKGLPAPPIIGYTIKSNHNPNKIMRVLNTFYKYYKEVNGSEPMPLALFKERKRIIEALSANENL